jgi:hypothetical protein
MRAKIIKGIKWASTLLVLAAIIFFGIRVYDIQRGPPLARWHTYVPHELRAKELDAADWSRYLAEEAKIFEAVGTDLYITGHEHGTPSRRPLLGNRGDARAHDLVPLGKHWRR